MTKKLLIADDDGVVLATLSMGLRQAGYQVVEARDAESAYQAVSTERPDVAVLDIHMPGMSGIELSRRLFEEFQVPVVFLTAYDERELVESAIGTGAFGYVIKPIDVARLIPVIETAAVRGQEVAGIKGAMDKNKQINAAVGVLMERHRVSMPKALEAMRAVARRDRKKLHVLALEILSATEQDNRFFDEFKES
ncbi:MAG: response regulator [Gammaproteobacteria bacterium]|nr:response regulator [Gammaproteobacteria bacterium]